MPFIIGDSTFLILIPAMLLAFWAQMRVQSTFRKWSEVGARRGVTGAEVARSILNGAGIYDVAVERVPGHLSDHYDPRAKVLRLSDSTYGSNSVAALGVAAHEVGHAIQHDVGYVALTVRNLVWPVASIGSTGGPILFMIGLFFGRGGGSWLMELGIVLFALAVGFFVITLPVEFNASNRALAILEGESYLTTEEMKGARAVLWAAAMTYVASAAMAISQLVRLLLLRGMVRDDD